MRYLHTLIAIGTCASCGPPAVGPDAQDDAPVDAAVIRVTETGTVSDATTHAPIANAMVCVNGVLASALCATTTAAGTYSLSIPFPFASTNISVSTSAAGYLGNVVDLVEDSTTQRWSPDIALASTADATTLLATNAGFTYPSTTFGFVEVIVTDGSTGSNATVGTIVSATATMQPAIGAGPVYLDASGTPDQTLASTSATGELLFGNLPAGMYSIAVHAPGKTCTSVAADLTINGEWFPTGDETLLLSIDANALTTRLLVYCT